MGDSRVKTYVFMDIESTGLPGVGEKPKIAEISFVAVQRNNLSESNRYIPRILDKLLICCNPQKPMTSGAAWITGLYNDALEHLTPLDDDAVEMLSRFLKRLPQPVCLLAHNGNKFDFPMLKMELELLGQRLADDVLCADTLEAFRSLDVQNESTESEGRFQDTDSTAAKRICTDNNSSAHMITATEITPVKVGDVDNMRRNLIPPPAPKKRQIREDRTRCLGNTKTARRRLLQDDITGMRLGGNSRDVTSVSKNGLEFRISIPSPPPSPIMPRQQKMGARRRLKFGSTSSNQNQSQEEVRINSCTETVDSVEDLQKFPEDFSDSSSDEEDDSTSVIDEAQTLSYSQTGCGDAPDLSHSDSLPDEDLIAAIDAMAAPVIAVIENDAISNPQNVINPSANTVDAIGLPEKCNEKSYSTNLIALGSTDMLNPTPSIMPPPKPSTSGEYSGQTTPKQKFQISDSSLVSNANKNFSHSAMKEPDNVKPSTSTATPVNQELKPSVRLSYKLEEIYKRTFGQSPRVSHTAEDDCISLIKIVQSCSGRFSEWINKNAAPFSKITKMY